MAFRFDPRGDLPPPMIQSTYYKPLLPSGGRVGENIGSSGKARQQFTSMRPYDLSSKTTTRGDYQQSSHSVAVQCDDWIFSSASNVHIAIDRSAFKNYTRFKSYVLTVVDSSPVKVRGIGMVDLRIRRQPGSKESHTITLENVLHVPNWICNVFSDIYFEPINDFEHTWTDFGVSFLRKEEGRLKYWGFTEGFLGLERLVLTKKLRGRSPMLEDRDREVFSVNLTWPQGQQDKWTTHLATEEKKRQHRRELKLKQETQSDPKEVAAMTVPAQTQSKVSLDLTREHRRGLTDLSTNIMHQRIPSDRASSLKAQTTRGRGSSFTERFSTLRLSLEK